MKQTMGNVLENGRAKYAFKYTIKKLVHIMPFVVVGTVMYYVAAIVSDQYNVQYAVYLFLQMPLELLQLSMTDATGLTFNYPMWYLSALMIALPLVMYCYLINNDFFESYMITVVPMLIYGWMNNTYHTLGLWHEWTGIIHTAAIRAFADLLLGCFVYKCSGILSNLKISELSKGILTLIEVGGFGVICIVSFKSRGGYSFQCAVFLMILSLSITFSMKSWTAYWNGIGWTAFCRVLGKLSIPVFCTHASVLKIVEYYFSLKSYITKVLFSFVLLFIISFALLFLEASVRKIIANKAGCYM